MKVVAPANNSHSTAHTYHVLDPIVEQEFDPESHRLRHEEGYFSPNPSPRSHLDKAWSFNSLEGRSPADQPLLPHEANHHSHYHMGNHGWEVANRRTAHHLSPTVGYGRGSFSSPRPSPQNSYSSSTLEHDFASQYQPEGGSLVTPLINDDNYYP